MHIKHNTLGMIGVHGVDAPLGVFTKISEATGGGGEGGRRRAESRPPARAVRGNNKKDIPTQRHRWVDIEREPTHRLSFLFRAMRQASSVFRGSKLVKPPGIKSYDRYVALYQRNPTIRV